MKRSLVFVGAAVLSLILVFGCGKPEEPAKAQKQASEPKAAPAQKVGEHQEHAKQEQEKKEPTKPELEHKESVKYEHEKPETTKSEEKHGQKSDINQALLAYLAKTGDDPQNANPHQTAQIDLNGDGYQDALVLLQNPIYFCGSGGCTMLVFKGTKSGFKFVSRSTLIHSPVVVSDNKTHGWRDLVVEVSGGGATPKKVALKFTGGKYPLNPSTQPSLPKNQPFKGTKVF